MQRNIGLFIHKDNIVTTGLYLWVDHKKVLLIIFSRENSLVSFCPGIPPLTTLLVGHPYPLVAVSVHSMEIRQSWSDRKAVGNLCRLFFPITNFHLSYLLSLASGMKFNIFDCLLKLASDIVSHL